MDKRTLTREELGMLRRFIVSRSSEFAEPSVQLEIMDHFACKTEEILAAEPGISFDAAMRKAHVSFGVKGFAPIADAYKKALTVQYRGQYRREFGKVLGSYHLAGLLIAGLLAHQLYLLVPRLSGQRMDGFCVILLLEMVYTICFFTGRHLIAVRHKHRIFYDKSSEVSSGAVAGVWSGLLLIILQPKILPEAMAIFTGMLAFILLLNLLVMKRLFERAGKDAALTEEQFRQVL